MSDSSDRRARFCWGESTRVYEAVSPTPAEALLLLAAILLEHEEESVGAINITWNEEDGFVFNAFC